MTALSIVTNANTENWTDLYKSESIALQLTVVCVSLALGMVIYILYSLYSAVITGKKTYHDRRLLLAFTDIFFWLIITAGVFIIYYFINDGKIRFYNFLWLASGFSAAYNIKLLVLKRKKLKK